MIEHFRKYIVRVESVVKIDKVLLDEHLSWRAKGIMAYLSSNPNAYIFRVRDLVKASVDGREAVHSALRELESQKYIVWQGMSSKEKQ